MGITGHRKDILIAPYDLPEQMPNGRRDRWWRSCYLVLGLQTKGSVVRTHVSRVTPISEIGYMLPSRDMSGILSIQIETSAKMYTPLKCK